MGKSFARIRWTERDISEILTSVEGLEPIVWFTADRGPHLTSVRCRTPNQLREIFGPRPNGDLLYLALERAMKAGSTVRLTRLLYLSDPTDAGTVDALASEVTVQDSAGVPADKVTFYLSELGEGGDAFDVVVEDGTAANTFKVTLTNPDEDLVEDEVYDNLSVDTDLDTYFETVLNVNNQGRLRATDEAPTAAPTFPDDLPANGTYDLASGSNGTALNEASVVGDSAAGTGIHAAGPATVDPEVQCWLYFVPTPTITAPIVAALAVFAEGGDVWGLCGPPDNADTADAIAFRNGTAPYSHTAFDTSYVGLVYAEHLAYDAQAGVNKLLPAVGELAPLLVKARDQRRGGAWWLAPAGPRRGGVSPDVLGLSDDVGIPTRSAEADDLVGANYNPFVTRHGRIRWWGNSTLLLDDTSILSNLKVRIMLVALRRQITPAVDDAQFQPNEPTTWKTLYLKVNPILENLRAQGAFANFAYLGDQDASRADDPDQLNVNNVADIAAGKYKVRIPIQPFSDIDQWIDLVMEVTSTAVRFEEVVPPAA